MDQEAGERKEADLLNLPVVSYLKAVLRDQEKEYKHLWIAAQK